MALERITRCSESCQSLQIDQHDTIQSIFSHQEKRTPERFGTASLLRGAASICLATGELFIRPV